MSSQAAAIDQVGETRRPALIDVFRARAEARAHLVANGLHTLQDSVDTLQAGLAMQAAAEAQGLLKEYGQDEIQRIMAESFARWRPE